MIRRVRPEKDEKFWKSCEGILKMFISVIWFAHSLYKIFEIFRIMHFGNEIELASDRLVLIFGEFLMKSQQLVVWKLYPLNLETFTRARFLLFIVASSESRKLSFVTDVEVRLQYIQHTAEFLISFKLENEWICNW